MNHPLTQRQIQRLGRLPPDYRLLAAPRRSPVVRRPDGQRLVQPNGRPAEIALVEQVQSYLRVERG
jgi:hypothetical protein